MLKAAVKFQFRKLVPIYDTHVFFSFLASPLKTSPQHISETEGILFCQKLLLDGTLFVRLLPCMNFESAAVDPACSL